tara:strand:+ start:5338 stop:6948 length:1611 start_codon:yes stop_codon:yes gene_type:complete
VSIRNPNSGFLGGAFGGNKSPFFEIYVQEVLSDPSSYKFPKEDSEEPEDYLLVGNNITEQEVLEAPYNSIIGRVLNGNDHNSEIIVYPMMPAHMTLPIKAGEHVWAMYNGGRYYWLCRKNFDQQINDVNIAWAGRYKAETSFKSTKGAAKDSESESSSNVLPKNQNPKINTIFPPEVREQNQIDMQTYWSERSKSILEPVPRYKKRPGDLVLQGSNNTLICLGLGGGHKKEDELTYGSVAASKQISGVLPDVSDGYNRGTIDIVTGRGRYQPDAATNSSSLGEFPERTSCATIMSEFGYKENDKNTTINDAFHKKSPIEGDPDFGFDASRIYISSYCEIDNEFSLIPNYPKIPTVVTADVGSVPETSKGASIVLKSDNLRLVARQHVAADFFARSNAEDVNGSIRLVKEGTRDGDGHSTIDGLGASMISLESDGTVVIDGATVVIGTGREVSNAAGDQIFLGAGATEPIVLGNLMTKLLSDFFTELQNWLSLKYDSHIHPTGTGPSGPPTVMGNDAGTGAAKDALQGTLSKIGKTK